MLTFHIFNPEHDHALAANLPRFTPPHAARQIRSDLSFLPALWAEDGDVVIVDDVQAAENAYRKLKLQQRSDVTFVEHADVKALLASCDDVTIKPWGWDAALCGTLQRAGIPAQFMPQAAQLDEIRTLSNRATAVALLNELRDDDCCTGTSQVCSSYEEMLTFLDSHHMTVLKAPWSCSGRGVRYLDFCSVNENTLRWAQATIRRQHTIIAEEKCCRVADFAVEFMAESHGDVRAIGLSLFTTVNGAYTGNMLASEEKKRALLEQYIPLSVLDSVTRRIEHYLSRRINGAYVGPLGVDMMIVAGTGEAGKPSFLLNPCIEINLRRTMGHLALALSARGHRGTMDIAYENKSYKVKITNNNL